MRKFVILACTAVLVSALNILASSESPAAQIEVMDIFYGENSLASTIPFVQFKLKNNPNIYGTRIDNPIRREVFSQLKTAWQQGKIISVIYDTYTPGSKNDLEGKFYYQDARWGNIYEGTTPFVAGIIRFR